MDGQDGLASSAFGSGFDDDNKVTSTVYGVGGMSNAQKQQAQMRISNCAHFQTER